MKHTDPLIRKALPGTVLENEPLHLHTTFRIGGPAEIMVLPSSIDDVKETVEIARENKVPLYIMGGGSNILAPDEGVKGITLKMGDNFSRFELGDTGIRAQAGVKLSILEREARLASLGGLEFSAGIPGTLGGALYMNCGAFEEEIYNLIESVTSLSPGGELRTRSRVAINAGYRRTSFMRTKDLILEAVLRLKKREFEEILKRAGENLETRKRRQPLQLACAGSVFKRSGPVPPGKLIEESGLKGAKIGDAEVSEKHANFIINRGEAKSREVKELINVIQGKVQRKTGILLEREIIYFEDEARIF